MAAAWASSVAGVCSDAVNAPHTHTVSFVRGAAVL